MVCNGAFVDFTWRVVIAIVSVLFGPREDLAAVNASFHITLFFFYWRNECEILNSNF